MLRGLKKGVVYYPFGLTFNSYQRENSLDQKYLYNGKELQNELNLGWLDYGARMYDPALGRFYKLDRYSSDYMMLSPYNYTANNPINFVDYNGDYIIIHGQDDDGNRYSVMYENGKAYHYSKDKKGNVVKGDEYDGQNKFIEQSVSDLNSIAGTKKGEKRLNDLQNSKSEYGIKEASALPQSRFEESAKGGGTIYYSQGGGILDGVSYSNSSFALGHELQHAWDLDQAGEKYFTMQYKGRKYSEKNAVEFENYLRAKAGESKMRTNYGNITFFNNSSPDYFLRLQDPLRANEAYRTPPTTRQAGQDATYFVPNYKPMRVDSRTGKFVNPNE